MVRTLWDSITEFLSPEAGQRRTQALQEFGRDVEYYVPPELRGLLGFAAEMTPTASLERASQAGGEMLAPGRTPMERVGSAGRMLSETAGVAAPIAVAQRAGMTAAQALQEGLLGASVAGQGAADAARRFALDEAGSVGRGAPLPTPRNDAEAMARDILEMRAAGRAGDVTDEMRAAADPLYMFENTPLPMDEASRMARRNAMYGKDRYHGSNMDFTGFSGNVFTSDNPTVASTYNRGMLDAQIYPVVTREGPMGDVTVEGGLSNWNRLSPDMIDDPAIARELDMGLPISTRDIERQAMIEGRSGVTFRDINDLGPGFNSQQFKGLGYTPEQEAALRQQYLTELSVPSEVDVRLSPNLVRSRFALFDPEFRHLRNLSAGVGGLGLLSLPQDEEMQ